MRDFALAALVVLLLSVSSVGHAALPRGIAFFAGNETAPVCTGDLASVGCPALWTSDLCASYPGTPEGATAHLIGVWMDDNSIRWPSNQNTLFGNVSGTFGTVASRYGKYPVACATSPGDFTTALPKVETRAIYIWPACDAGQSETAEWITTVATGSTGMSFLPNGTPPTQLCSASCKVLADGLTYKAWIEPGHPEVGAKLWVELNATATGAVCLPGADASWTTAERHPTYACATTNTNCGSGGTLPGGSGTASLDATDKANLALTAQMASQTNTALRDLTGTGGQPNTAYSQLKKIADSQSRTITGTATDCSANVTCSGDSAKCSEFFFARQQYCHSKVIDANAVLSAEGTFDAMKSQSDATTQASLNKGLVNLDAGFSAPRWLSSGSCPAPVMTPLAFGSIVKNWTVSFQPVCDLATIIAAFVLAGAGLIAVRIFAGGMA